MVNSETAIQNLTESIAEPVDLLTKLRMELIHTYYGPFVLSGIVLALTLIVIRYAGKFLRYLRTRLDMDNVIIESFLSDYITRDDFDKVYRSIIQLTELSIFFIGFSAVMGIFQLTFIGELFDKLNVYLLRIVLTVTIIIFGIFMGEVLPNILPIWLIILPMQAIERQYRIKLDLMKVTGYLIRGIVYFLSMLLIGAILGVSGDAIALVVFLVIAFGMVLFVFLIKDQLPNAFAGVYLTATDSINIGDTIVLDDNVKGVIKSISLLHTTLEGKKGTLYIIPNRSLTSTIIAVTKRCDSEKATCKEE